MDFRYLQAFYLTAKYSSFRKAASELRVAPSAITRQVKLLENSCGELLILRTTKNFHLTVYGAQLYDQIRFFILSTADRKPDLAVGCIQSFFEHFLLKVINENKALWRPLISKIDIGTPSGLIKKLEAGELDFAILNEPLSAQLYKNIEIGTEEYVLVGNQSSKCYISISAFERVFEPKNDKIISVTSYNAGLALILTGFGYGVLPSHEERLGKAKITSSTKKIQQKVYLVISHQKLKYQSSIISKFIEQGYSVNI